MKRRFKGEQGRRLNRVETTSCMCRAAGIKLAKEEGIQLTNILNANTKDYEKFMENYFYNKGLLFLSDELSATIKATNTVGEEYTTGMSRLVGAIINNKGIYYLYCTLDKLKQRYRSGRYEREGDIPVIDFTNTYDAFMHCDVNKLAEAFASMYHSEGEDCDRLGCAKQEVNEAFMRMKTITPKVETNQSILLVCKDFGDTGDDVSLIKAKDLSVWKEKHKEKTETISDEMLTFMSTDDIMDAAMQQELPTRYAIELCSWDEILGWKLAPSSIYIYGLEFCLSRVLWEMTFFGIEPHGVEQAKADLDASIEESKKNLDENGKPHGIPFEDFVKELLGDDYTEDWYPEEEQERDRRNMAIASYKGNKEAEYLLLML